MGTDILLEVANHLVPVLKVLDREHNRHGEGQKGDQSSNDLKAEALVKSYILHRI